MHRIAVLVAVSLLIAGCQSTSPQSESGSGSSSEPPRAELSSSRVAGAFTFGAAGDFGATKNTARSLALLDGSDAEFFLALGDFDYDMTPTDKAWCRYVKKRLPSKGTSYPFELVAGNHEQDGGPDGRVRHFARCLPDRLGSSGTYASQYAFTYPRTDPFAKVIMISPRLTVDGHRYTYARGTADRRWLVRQIDDARAAGIRWVIVGMHHMCLSTGTDHRGCDSGHAVHNLLLRKKGHQVARDSQHTHGHAIDFFLPNVPTRRLWAWVKAQHLGGVGIYLHSGFVHMDTGPVRFWSGQ